MRIDDPNPHDFLAGELRHLQHDDAHQRIEQNGQHRTVALVINALDQLGRGR